MITFLVPLLTAQQPRGQQPHVVDWRYADLAPLPCSFFHYAHPVWAISYSVFLFVWVITGTLVSLLF
jgi:hypothetical protein